MGRKQTKKNKPPLVNAAPKLSILQVLYIFIEIERNQKIIIILND